MKKLLENWRRLQALNEARTLPQILHTLMGGRENIKTIGILTAENPQGKKATPEFNKEAMENLMKDLRLMNLGFRRIRGSFGSKENSLLVPNMTREEAVELGLKYDQESVIWGEREDGKVVFQYIEGSQTTQKRDVVLTGEKIQSREDFFSQEPKGPEGKAGKFIIPFFDDEYEMLDEEEELDQSPETQQIYEEINKRVEKILQQNRTGKSRWENRGMIKELKKKLVKKN